MGDSFKKVLPGQRLQISAEAYNAFLDAARSHKSGRHDLLADFADQFTPAKVNVERETDRYPAVPL